MTRLLCLPLALALAACTPDPADAPPEAGAPASAAAPADPAAGRPMTREDSAAMLQARFDSLQRAIGETRDAIDAGFRTTDSMRRSIDALEGDVEETRRRVDENQARTDALLGQ